MARKKMTAEEAPENQEFLAETILEDKKSPGGEKIPENTDGTESPEGFDLTDMPEGMGEYREDSVFLGADLDHPNELEAAEDIPDIPYGVEEESAGENHFSQPAPVTEQAPAPPPLL